MLARRPGQPSRNRTGPTSYSLAGPATVARAVLADQTVYLVTLVREPNPCVRHGEQRRLVIKRLDLLRQAKALFGESPELVGIVLHSNFLPSIGENIFVLIDGVKIAKRGLPGTAQADTWIMLEPGWMVRDVKGGKAIEVGYEPARMH